MVIKTKIIATVGPATADRKTMSTLIENGLDVFRLNFSHGTFDDYAKFLDEINADVEKIHGGLKGAVAVSDAFFPYRDGADALLAEGITGIIQPGDALRDYDVVLACNERKATMVFTGQRSFRH